MEKERSLLEVRQVMDRIERDLDSGTYHVGDWQKCLAELKGLDERASSMLGQDLTRISNKLHRRNRFLEAPAWMGFVFEYLLLATSILMMMAESALVRLASIILLALCLQPLIKISVGFLLGVRYAYVYLWYFEPRFKMRFGSYHTLERWKKLALQLSGSIGTPIALLAGWQVLGDEPLLAALCLAGALGAALMQVAAFAAVWFGVRKLGPFLLTNLTTPALLAKEWKER
jgi:hypothetical protein